MTVWYTAFRRVRIIIQYKYLSRAKSEALVNRRILTNKKIKSCNYKRRRQWGWQQNQPDRIQLSISCPNGGKAGIQGILTSKPRPWQGLPSFYWPRAPPGSGPSWHFQQRRTGRKYSPERFKMAGVSKSGACANGDKEGKILLNIPENMPVASFWFVFTNEITWCLFSFCFY